MEKTPNDIYRDVANETNLDPEEVAAIGGVESQHGKFNKPLAGGSARGIFQFQPKTAEYLDKGSSKNLSDQEVQSKLMKLYLQKNKVNNLEEAYTKHNLGPSRASKFLSVPDETLITDVIPKAVIKANPGLYNFKTVGEAKEKIREKLRKGKESSDILPNFSDLFKGEE